MAVELYLHTYNETMIAIVVNLASGGNRNLGRTGEAVEEGEERKRQAGRQAGTVRTAPSSAPLPPLRRFAAADRLCAYLRTYWKTGNGVIWPK